MQAAALTAEVGEGGQQQQGEPSGEMQNRVSQKKVSIKNQMRGDPEKKVLQRLKPTCKANQRRCPAAAVPEGHGPSVVL